MELFVLIYGVKDIQKKIKSVVAKTTIAKADNVSQQTL